MAHRLGVDVGGTFTDVLLIDTSTGRTWRAKTASTPHDQSEGVLRGIDRVCADAGIVLSAVTEVLHGTTIATNAILEHKGAKVGLVTTRGFRQVLQIARSFVPGGLAGWIIWPKPEPLAALEHTVEAVERVASDGGVVTELDVGDLRAKIERLRDQGIEALSVSLINSFANADHEKQIGVVAAEVLGPDVPVSLSSDVLPELREYERTVTTVANGYVQPQVARYVSSLADKLTDGGVEGPLYILRSDGGLASAATAATNPVNLLLSGPAGGVTGAVWAAEQAGTATSSPSTWAAPAPTSPWWRTSRRGSGARPGWETSTCGPPASTSAPSAPVVAPSPTSPRSPRHCGLGRSRPVPSRGLPHTAQVGSRRR